MDNRDAATNTEIELAGALSNLLYAARLVHDPEIDEWTDAVALGEMALASLKRSSAAWNRP